jgi:hypothetical protein
LAVEMESIMTKEETEPDKSPDLARSINLGNIRPEGVRVTRSEKNIENSLECNGLIFYDRHGFIALYGLVMTRN